MSHVASPEGLAAELVHSSASPKSFRPARLSGCYVYRISFTSRSLPHLCPGPTDPARGGGCTETNKYEIKKVDTVGKAVNYTTPGAPTRNLGYRNTPCETLRGGPLLRGICVCEVRL